MNFTNNLFQKSLICSFVFHLVIVCFSWKIPFNLDKKNIKVNETVLRFINKSNIPKKKNFAKKTPDLKNAKIKKVKITDNKKKYFVKDKLKKIKYKQKKRFIKKSRIYDEKTVNLSLNNIKAEEKDKFLEYFNILRLKIQKKLKYPVFAKRNKIQKNIKVFFSLSRNGILRSILVEKPEYNLEFNKFTMDILKDCSPFPEFPKEMNRDLLNFSLIIDYQKA